MNTDVKQRVLFLRKKGLTFQEIGKVLGFSRQRAHQIYYNNKNKQ